MSGKGPNILLIVSVILAVLIIGGAVMFAKKGPDSGEESAIPDVMFSGEQVVLPDEYSACSAGGQCIVVDTHCGFCCQYTAINARMEAAYNKIFDKNCSRFNGSFCKCFDLSSYPSCIEGKCQLVKWPDEQAAAPPPAPEPEPPPPVYTPAMPYNMPRREPVYEPPPYEPPVYEQPAYEPPAYEPPVYEQQAEPEVPAGGPFEDAGFDSPSGFERPAAPPQADDSLFAPLPDSMPDNMRAPAEDSYGGDPLNRPLPSGRAE